MDLREQTKRNRQIYEARLAGKECKDLALEYNLHIHTIKRIVERWARMYGKS
jgi:Mor family transcriptional regulator